MCSGVFTTRHTGHAALERAVRKREAGVGSHPANTTLGMRDRRVQNAKPACLKKQANKYPKQNKGIGDLFTVTCGQIKERRIFTVKKKEEGGKGFPTGQTNSDAQV